ncbi:MAG: vitamin B12-dependent ribonucleotide reductase [Thermoplasmata archaeon]
MIYEIWDEYRGMRKMQSHGHAHEHPVEASSENGDRTISAEYIDQFKEPTLTKNAIKVLERRYLKKDEKGKVIETPREMFVRVARTIASAEKNYGISGDELLAIEQKFYSMISSLDFVPNSPTLMNAGRELGQLSACFVLPVGDSIEEIFDAIKYTALIHKSGGGTGFSFSRLRPANDSVQSTKGVSSGPISFMEVFNAATETIKQGGTRRGANMGILRVDHPDILEFITAKKDQKRLTNFNISVALTDKFMRAVKEKQKYDLVNPRTGQIDRQLDANTVFDMITNMAWRNGEPGIIFIDRINRDNPTPDIGQIESTNPCGEQPLLPYESCNLGSINLAHMLRQDEHGWSIDWEKLRDLTTWAVRFLDDVIDVNRYPLPQIEEMTKANRKIGLGIMGFADMLLRLEVPYDSDEALEIGRNLMKFIHTTARNASQKLAEERGNFPNFHRSILKKRYPMMRNATVTTIAPTGTISIIAGCSSGIEPLFAIAYVRNVMDRDELSEINPVFEEVARKRGFYSDELMKKVAEKGSIAEIEEIPADVRRIFVTAHDITPEWHIKMQAAFQEHTDNAVSKTVNFPRTATPEDVRKVYMMAFELGLKGVTVYRDGSRDEQVLNIGKVNRKEGEGEESQAEKKERMETLRSPRPRPVVTRGTTQRLETGCGKLYVTINEDENGLCELFTQMGKSGGCTASQSEALARLISLALRSGIDVKMVIKQLRGIRCPSPLWQPGGAILSCPDAIAKALERYIEGKEAQIKPTATQQIAHKQNHVDKGDVCPECPECGAMVDYVEGCVVCRSCGYSRCW